MTVKELIETLQEFDENAEVFIAQQPTWPFQYSIGEVVEITARDEWELDAEEGEEEPADLDDRPNKVYIGEREQLGYLDGAARQALGWR